MAEPVVTLRHFFERAREGQLTGVRCGKCGELAIPPKELCPACGERAWQTVPLSGDGIIESFTVIRVAPRKFATEAPYAIAAVRLTEGVSLIGRVVDVAVDTVAVGMSVRFRPLTDGARTAIAFAPS